MTFLLVGTNGDEYPLSIGAWGWMLDAGVGLAFGCGPSFLHTRLVYDDARGPGSPTTNDGYPVTAAEAVAVSFVARGLVLVYREARRRHDAMRSDEREAALRDPRTRVLVSEADLKTLAEFAEWAERSGGFTIC